MCLLLTPVLIGFFYFLLRPLTVLMKQTRQAVRAVKVWFYPVNDDEGHSVNQVRLLEYDFGDFKSDSFQVFLRQQIGAEHGVDEGFKG
jgi:hypothetical protein